MTHRIKFLISALFTLLFLYSPLTLAQDAAVLKRMEDREQIEHLMWRYTRALDSFDPDAYVSVFTEDGAFGNIKGRDALYKMIADLRDSRAKQTAEGNPPAEMFHATENYWTEFVNDNHARHHAYWVTYYGANGADSPARMIQVGRSVDDLVRVNNQWLIQSRNIAPQD